MDSPNDVRRVNCGAMFQSWAEWFKQSDSFHVCTKPPDHEGRHSDGWVLWS